MCRSRRLAQQGPVAALPPRFAGPPLVRGSASGPVRSPPPARALGGGVGAVPARPCGPLPAGASAAPAAVGWAAPVGRRVCVSVSCGGVLWLFLWFRLARWWFPVALRRRCLRRGGARSLGRRCRRVPVAGVSGRRRGRFPARSWSVGFRRLPLRRFSRRRGRAGWGFRSLSVGSVVAAGLCSVFPCRSRCLRRCGCRFRRRCRVRLRGCGRLRWLGFLLPPLRAAQQQRQRRCC